MIYFYFLFFKIIFLVKLNNCESNQGNHSFISEHWWKFGWSFWFFLLLAFNKLWAFFRSWNGFTERVLNEVWRRKILLLRRMDWIHVWIRLGMIRLWKRGIIWRIILWNVTYRSTHSCVILIRNFSRTLIKVWIPTWGKLWGWWHPLLLVRVILMIRMKSLLLEFLLYFLLRFFLILTRLKSRFWSFLFNFFIFLFFAVILLQFYQELKSLLNFFYLWHDFSLNFFWLSEHLINFSL